SSATQVTVQNPAGVRELHAVSVYSGNVDGSASQNHEQGQAAVTVDRPGTHVSLFLGSYEPVVWYVSATSGTIIEKVILGGYYRQRVEGLGAGVQVINRFFDEGQGTSDYIWMGTSLAE